MPKKTIEEVLKENRPNLSINSIRTYKSTLTNLYNKIYEDDEIDIRKFKNYDDILKQIKDLEGGKRKSVLSALVVFCGDNDCAKYRELMLNDAKEYNDKQKENKMTDAQEENWISQEQIKEVYDTYEKEAKILFKLKKLNSSQLQRIQNFIIICLMSGIFIPPRRSTDWTEFKIKNIDTSKDNYMDKKSFIFNTYKTSKFYKQQKIDMPLELFKIIKKWIEVNPTEYLLFDSNGNKLTPVKLNQRNNKIYDGKISTNMLRHSFITEKYVGKSLPTVKEMSETAEDMAHSTIQHLEYIKTQPKDNKKDDSDSEDEPQQVKMTLKQILSKNNKK